MTLGCWLWWWTVGGTTIFTMTFHMYLTYIGWMNWKIWKTWVNLTILIFGPTNIPKAGDEGLIGPCQSIDIVNKQYSISFERWQVHISAGKLWISAGVWRGFYQHFGLVEGYYRQYGNKTFFNASNPLFIIQPASQRYLININHIQHK